MWVVQCPYCSGSQGRCATTASGRSVTECCSCGRVVEERQTQVHDLFLLRAQDTPLCLVTSDLSSIPSPSVVGPRAKEKPEEEEEEEDPFEPTGFITAFSTWSLEQNPVFARSSLSFSGHLAELERALDSSSTSSGPVVVVDNLRAYLQIIDVSSILGLDYDISDHAFQLFRDCSSATCLRNRSVEALATAALVQAIREAQEPRTLQEISSAANVPQKEIGKYIKILGEALQLSQPINSNSISVHMPRFCTLLQLNKSAQELATHIGEVVINKCFCTRRNPISISAAAIYLACQLEDKRKTQAEICKVTGLTEVTLRKVYKELLENWDDLLPSNYTPAVPPEKAFPTTAITSGRSSSAPRVVDLVENQVVASASVKDKQAEATELTKKPPEPSEMDHQTKVKEEADGKGNTHGSSPPSGPHVAPGSIGHSPMSKSNQAALWQPQHPFGNPPSKQPGEDQKHSTSTNVIDVNVTQQPVLPKVDQKGEEDPQMLYHFSGGYSASSASTKTWPHKAPLPSQRPYGRFTPPASQMVQGNQNRSDLHQDRSGDSHKGK